MLQYLIRRGPGGVCGGGTLCRLAAHARQRDPDSPDGLVGEGAMVENLQREISSPLLQQTLLAHQPQHRVPGRVDTTFGRHRRRHLHVRINPSHHVGTHRPPG